MEDEIKISRGELELVINTLKQIDVRGFDSMDKLVGVVITLERWWQQKAIHIDSGTEPAK